MSDSFFVSIAFEFEKNTPVDALYYAIRSGMRTMVMSFNKAEKFVVCDPRFRNIQPIIIDPIRKGPIGVRFTTR